MTNKELLMKAFKIHHEEDFKLLLENDYGIEIKTYPNNQPSVVLKYTSMAELLKNLEENNDSK